MEVGVWGATLDARFVVEGVWRATLAEKGPKTGSRFLRQFPTTYTISQNRENSFEKKIALIPEL